MKTFYLDRQGHSNFIDFLKGVCILWVLWTHVYFYPSQTLFPLWGEMAVPIFIMIQVVNTYRKGIDQVKFPKIKKLFLRILLPALIVWFILFIINSLWGGVLHADKVLVNWGYGPGCYYPWIYLEFAFLLPIIAWIFNRLKRPFYILFFCLGVSVLFEVICSYVNPAPWIYSKLFFRYFFLIYLGYEWLEHGIVLNKKNIVFALVGAIFIVLFYYTDMDFEPLFYTTSWRVHHWICYFYVLYVLVFLLAMVHKSQLFPQKIKLLFEYLGKASYDIFVCQMAVFALLHPGRLSFFTYPLINGIVYVIVTLFFSLVLGILLYRIRNCKIKFFKKS